MRNLWIAAVFALVTVSGCETLTPNKAVEVTVDTVVALSRQIDSAERRGIISNDTEDRLQNKLLDALNLLDNTASVGDISDCGEGRSKNECVQDILLAIEKVLLEAEQ